MLLFLFSHCALFSWKPKLTIRVTNSYSTLCVLLASICNFQCYFCLVLQFYLALMFLQVVIRPVLELHIQLNQDSIQFHLGQPNSIQFNSVCITVIYQRFCFLSSTFFSSRFNFLLLKKISFNFS